MKGETHDQLNVVLAPKLYEISTLKEFDVITAIKQPFTNTAL